MDTLLSELGEILDPEKLAHLSPHLSLRYSQRLEYLLDVLEYDSITQPLHQFLSHQRVTYTPLRPDASTKSSAIDAMSSSLLIDFCVIEIVPFVCGYGITSLYALLGLCSSNPIHAMYLFLRVSLAYILILRYH